MFEEPRGLSLEPNRSSRHAVGIHALPPDVYRALTDPEELGRWFVAEAEIELRPGGSYRWIFGDATARPADETQVVVGRFTAIAQNELLRMRTEIDEVETGLEFRLEPWRDGTLLTLTHGGFPGDEEWDDTFRAFDRSWEVELHVLKLYLERARGMVREMRFHEATMPAAPEPVFAAFATSPGLEGWLADRAAAEPQPGGEIVLEWKGAPPTRGHLAVCDPDAFLLMTWEEERPSLVAVALSECGGREAAPPEGGATDIRLEHRLFAPDPTGFKVFDWEAALGRLSRFLAKQRSG